MFNNFYKIFLYEVNFVHVIFDLFELFNSFVVAEKYVQKHYLYKIKTICIYINTLVSHFDTYI